MTSTINLTKIKQILGEPINQSSLPYSFSSYRNQISFMKSANTIRGNYISTDSSNRTILVRDNTIRLEDVYNMSINATVIMNGGAIGIDRNASSMNRSSISGNQFDIFYRFYDGTYTKSARLVFRMINGSIDVYQSDARYWSGDVYDANSAGSNSMTIGSGGYGVVYIQLIDNSQPVKYSDFFNINRILYNYSLHTFNNATASGGNGPTLLNLTSSYSSQTWSQYISYLNSDNGKQLWKVPRTGYYDFTLAGAGTTASNAGAVIVSKSILLNKGDILNIVVGQQGQNSGGGGTFVFKGLIINSNNIIFCAGGAGWGSNAQTGITAGSGTRGGDGGGCHTRGTGGSGGGPNTDGVDGTQGYDNGQGGAAAAAGGKGGKRGKRGEPWNGSFSSSSVGAFGGGGFNGTNGDNGWYSYGGGGGNGGGGGYQGGGGGGGGGGGAGCWGGGGAGGNSGGGSSYSLYSSNRIYSSTITISNTGHGYVSISPLFNKELVSGITYHFYNGYFNDDTNWFIDKTEISNGIGLVTDMSSIVTCTNNIVTAVNGRDSYSVEWVGYFFAPKTGTYTFYTNTDDASYLWIGDKALNGYTTSNSLVSNPGIHGMQEISGTISLVASCYYPIRIQYGENYGGDNCIISFEGPGISKTTDFNNYFFSATGLVQEFPGENANTIRKISGTEANGIYWINLPTVGPTQVYCIMEPTIDGGGWMMAMKATTGTTFNYDSNYWTTANTLNPTDNTINNGDAKFNTMNYFQSKDILALWPDIPSNYNSGTGGNLNLLSTYNNWCWLKNNYNSGTRQTLINFFSTASNLSFGTAKGVERGTAFSSQAGNSFYGANFTSYANMKLRWGLSWNNEYDWGTNDVIGGIGMYCSWGSLQSLSAGDQIGCCQDQTGINRSARVEVYIR